MCLYAFALHSLSENIFHVSLACFHIIPDLNTGYGLSYLLFSCIKLFARETSMTFYRSHGQLTSREKSSRTRTPFKSSIQLAFSFHVLGHEASAKCSVPIQPIMILHKVCIIAIKRTKWETGSKPS